MQRQLKPPTIFGVGLKTLNFLKDLHPWVTVNIKNLNMNLMTNKPQGSVTYYS